MNETKHKPTCCICLEEQTPYDIENDNRLIEYNHCGNYLVHNKCLNGWNLNECLICRKKFYENIEEGNNEINYENNRENESNTTLVISNNHIIYQKMCINFCFVINFVGLSLYFINRNDY